MRVLIKRRDCGGAGWGRGIEDYDGNATDVTEYPEYWDSGPLDCPHEGEIEIIDVDYEYFDDDVL